MSTDPAASALLSELPQARFESFGAHALSDAELLSCACSITRDKGISILTEVGGLPRLARMSPPELRRVKGVGSTMAQRISATMEIWRRAQIQEVPAMFNCPGTIFSALSPLTLGLAVEKCWVFCLNRKNRLLRRVEISSGSATSALLHPREVFRTAVAESATAVILAHNHPSGDPSPSGSDVAITRQVNDAAKAVDVALLDHVIIGTVGADPFGRGYYSFRDAGLL